MMKLFKFFNSHSVEEIDAKARYTKAVYDFKTRLLKSEISTNSVDRCELVDLNNAVNRLDLIDLQHSNLQYLTDVVYIKSSVNVLIEKYQKLQQFEKFDESITKSLLQTINDFTKFINDLCDHVTLNEKKMIKSIINSTLKERGV